MYDHSLLYSLPPSFTGDYTSIFSTFSLSDDTSVYNTNLWGGLGAFVDFTSIAHRTSPSSSYYCKLVAITKRHVLSTTHTSTGASIGDEYTWIALDGTRHTRTIVDRITTVSGISGLSDYDVAYLDSDLPSTINIAPLCGDATAIVDGTPVIKSNQTYKAHVPVIGSLGAEYIVFTAASSTPMSTLSGNWVLNDSGCPAFLLNDRQLVYLTAATLANDAGSGPCVIYHNDDILAAAAILDARNAVTGYVPSLEPPAVFTKNPMRLSLGTFLGV